VALEVAQAALGEGGDLALGERRAAAVEVVAGGKRGCIGRPFVAWGLATQYVRQALTFPAPGH
jgi:hypothetical protein